MFLDTYAYLIRLFASYYLHSLVELVNINFKKYSSSEDCSILCFNEKISTDALCLILVLFGLLVLVFLL